jgi:hypothetical protein
VYSVGATIWSLLTGRPPFTGSEESARALTARILHSAPPRTLRADVPPALEELLARCLAKSPEQRPASALELARDLQRVQRDEGLALTTISVDEGGTAPAPLEAVPGEPAPRVEEPRSGEPVAPPARRRGISATGWWSAAAVALVVIVALLAWRAASAGDRSFAPGSAARTTRATAASGVVPPPTVTAHRAGRNVDFRWRASDAPHAGDSYVWRIRGGSSQLTNGTTTTVHRAARVCLQVRLSRPGRPPSAWAHACA